MSTNPQITVTSPLLPDLQDFLTYLQQIWDCRWITNNDSSHQQLEQALAKYLLLFTNGMLPLIAVLQALGFTKGILSEKM